jgi:hypothetical protein
MPLMARTDKTPKPSHSQRSSMRIAMVHVGDASPRIEMRLCVGKLCALQAIAVLRPALAAPPVLSLSLIHGLRKSSRLELQILQFLMLL